MRLLRLGLRPWAEAATACRPSCPVSAAPCQRGLPCCACGACGAAALSQKGDYRGVGDVVLQTLRREGPLAFWSGISANAGRLCSWNM